MSIEARSLTMIRGERVLFSELSFKVDLGECLQVMGENGSGKSSLLRLLSHLLEPNAGQVLWHGVSSDRVFHMGHRLGLKPGLSVVENLHFDCRYTFSSRLIQETLQQVGLRGLQDVLCARLSEGQQKRVVLARLLMARAAVWILDEPMANLDVEGRRLFLRYLEEHLMARGVALISTHEPLSFGKTLCLEKRACSAL